jgi:hypothetical protein
MQTENSSLRITHLEDSVHTFDLQAAAIHWEAMLHHRVLAIRKLDLPTEAIHRVLQQRDRERRMKRSLRC